MAALDIQEASAEASATLTSDASGQWGCGAYFEQRLATATKRTYNAGAKKFLDFCKLFNVLNPYPVSQIVLCSFVGYLAKSGLACSTIKTYVSAVRFQQIALGHAELRGSGMPKYNLVQRGIRREKSGEVARPSRLPTTPVLRQLRSCWSTEVRRTTWPWSGRSAIRRSSGSSA